LANYKDIYVGLIILAKFQKQGLSRKKDEIKVDTHLCWLDHSGKVSKTGFE